MNLEYRFYPIDPRNNTGRIVCVDLELPEDDRLVGVLEFGRPGNATQRMYAIVAGWLRVSPEYRRLGIATELWRRFLEHLAGKGLVGIYAEYTADGAAFIRSYVERCGPVSGLRGGWERCRRAAGSS